jgi:hypothetical protein
MEISDLLIFGGFALALILPFWAVYFVLTWLGWNARGRMFSDTWKIWLTWVISTLVIHVVIAGICVEFRFVPGFTFTFLVFAAVFAGNVLAVAFVAKMLLRPGEEGPGSIITAGKERSIAPRPAIWITSAVASMAPTVTVFLFVALWGAVYERFNPPPPSGVQFGLYDI